MILVPDTLEGDILTSLCTSNVVEKTMLNTMTKTCINRITKKFVQQIITKKRVAERLHTTLLHRYPLHTIYLAITYVLYGAETRPVDFGRYHVAIKAVIGQ